MMSLKDMVVTAVYEKPDGLYLFQVVEAIAARFQAKTTTKKVVDVLNRNPKLFFAETNGKIKCPVDYDSFT